MKFLRPFLARGVFWRKLLRWAVLNVPIWIEPAVMALWAGLFLFWREGRRGVMHNLKAVIPGSSPFANFFEKAS